MAPQDRGPSDEDRRRMDEIRDAQQKPAGDPRVTGARGTPGHPMYVHISGATDKFFDSFRAPTPEQGPQRPQEREHSTGERMFRSVIQDHQAIAQAARQVVGQLRSAADMATRFSGDVGAFATVVRTEQQAERTRIDAVLTRIEKHYDQLSTSTGTGGGRRRPRRGGETPAPPSQPIGGQQHPALDLDNPLPDGTFPPAPPAPPGGPTTTGGGQGGGRAPRGRSGRPGGQVRPDQSYSRLTHHQAALHHGGLVRQMQRQVGEQIHQRAGMGTDQSPTVVPTRDDNGIVTGFEEHNAEGELLRAVPIDHPDAPGMARTAIRMASMSRAAASIASGGGLTGALRGGVSGAMGAASGAGGAGGAAGLLSLGSKALPVVGAVLAAADIGKNVAEFVTDQRAKNAAYQSIYGGTNFAGFGQRFQEEGFAIGQLFSGGMTSDDAHKLFQGVSGLGFRETERSGALSFASDQYKQSGMGVDQSLKAIQVAAAGANSSLAGLNQALTDVTQSATESGQSADVMREKFINTFAASTQAGYGTQSATVAAAVTQAGPGRDRTLANVDMTGMFSEMQQRITAAQLGQPYGTFVANNALGNIQPGLQQKDKQTQGLVNTVVQPDQKKMIDAEIQKAGGIDKVRDDPGKRREIGLKLLQSGFDPGVMKQLASVYGIDLSNVPTEDVGTWVVDQMTGGGALAPKAAEQQARDNQRDLSQGEKDRQGSEGGFFGGGGGSDFVQNNLGMFSGDKNKPVLAYGERQKETGKTDPAVEAMISSLGSYGEVGIKVKTKDGDRVVSQADAITYYGDQIASGDATVVGGPADVSGRTVGELTGVTEKNYQRSSKDDDPEGKVTGVSEDEWRKSHATTYDTAAQNAAGKVTISLSDDAKRLFNITTEGNVVNGQVESGATSGVPPSVGTGPR